MFREHFALAAINSRIQETKQSVARSAPIQIQSKPRSQPQAMAMAGPTIGPAPAMEAKRHV